MVEAEVPLDRGQQRGVDHAGHEHEKQRRHEQQDGGQIRANALDAWTMRLFQWTTLLYSLGLYLALYRFPQKSPAA